MDSSRFELELSALYRDLAQVVKEQLGHSLSTLEQRLPQLAAERRAELVRPPQLGRRLHRLIIAEYERTVAAVEAITRARLLARVTWLRCAVERRSPLVDVLNLIQVEALRQSAGSPSSAEDRPLLVEILRLTVGGIAASLRTTG